MTYIACWSNLYITVTSKFVCRGGVDRPGKEKMYEDTITDSSTQTIKCVKPGDRIKIMEMDDSDNMRTEIYTVQKVYPYMVLATNGNKSRCFSIGDLVMLRLELQEPRLEALRRFTEEDTRKMKRKGIAI